MSSIKKAIKSFEDNIKKQKFFMTNASHELKTIITSITTSTDVLLLDNNKWLISIKNQTQKILKLVNDLILLSKIDENKNINKS